MFIDLRKTWDSTYWLVLPLLLMLLVGISFYFEIPPFATPKSEAEVKVEQEQVAQEQAIQKTNAEALWSAPNNSLFRAHGIIYSIRSNNKHGTLYCRSFRDIEVRRVWFGNNSCSDFCNDPNMEVTHPGTEEWHRLRTEFVPLPSSEGSS